MALTEPWSIKSRAHVCAVTEEHFKDGESFYTAIFPDPESSGYLRKDFSVGAWEKLENNTDVPFSFWKSTYRAPVKEDKVEVTDESPEALLRRLIEEDEEHTENARYILAVMLERKKQLVEADSQHTPTGIIRIYEQRKTGDVFIVKDPNIPLSEIEKVQEEVSMLLESGGRTPDVEPEEQEPQTQEPGDGSQVPGEDQATPATETPEHATPPEDQADQEDQAEHRAPPM